MLPSGGEIAHIMASLAHAGRLLRSCSAIASRRVQGSQACSIHTSSAVAAGKLAGYGFYHMRPLNCCVSDGHFRILQGERTALACRLHPPARVVPFRS